MLDHLSNGRLEIGVGRGGVMEAYFWGQEGDEHVNARRYEEVLGALKAGLAHDELNFKGEFYAFDEVPMRLRPLQRPTPPFWYMRNPETAAIGGMNCIGSLTSGWLGGPYARSLDDLRELRDIPIPIETWAVFDALFAWEQRQIDDASSVSAAAGGETATTFGTTMISATGARSLIGSKFNFMMCGAIACALLVPTSSV